jgi:hypothetical protein|tara:strand:- start:2342 stop:2755 length:414 start_codon:yes stop_codon:yes gene_type:complete
MASFAQEKEMKAHLLLIEEAGTYAGYFSQGTNGDGDPSAYYLTNDSDKAAADTLLDAKVAELTEIGSETAAGEGPSDFASYTPIHFDDDVAGADYRAWFVNADGDYFKADNGNSDDITEISDADEIATLLTDSGYIV